MEWNFIGTAFEWRGPAPFMFVATPLEVSQQLKELSPMLSYGWGCIPCSVVIGRSQSTTALFPKNGSYLVPIKVAVQRAGGITVGQEVAIQLSVNTGSCG